MAEADIRLFLVLLLASGIVISAGITALAWCLWEWDSRRRESFDEYRRRGMEGA